MNKKLIIIMALMFCAALSVSAVAAANDAQEPLSADDSDDVLSEDSSLDETLVKNNDKLAAGEDTELKDNNVNEGRTHRYGVKAYWYGDNDNAGHTRPSEVTYTLLEMDPDDPNKYSRVGGSLNEGNNWFALHEGEGRFSIELDSLPSNYDLKHEITDGGCILSFNLKQNSGDSMVNPTDNATDNVTVKEIPVKEAEKEAKKEAKIVDNHNTGNPILLGLLAFSLAGISYSFRKKE